MPHARLYLEPFGFVRGRLSADLMRDGRALALAGTAIGFTGLRVKGMKSPCLLSVQDGAVAGLPDALTDTFTRLIAPRAPFAGLSCATTGLMGILNVTPDSFSDGGLHVSIAAAAEHGHRLAAAGAAIIDIGGESTRPGATAIDANQECERILPVLEALKPYPVPLSIDTRRAPVMRAALALGVAVINDVSALTYDADSVSVLANSHASVILMHAQGEPATMQHAPRYQDVVSEVYDYLEARIDACLQAGIARTRIAIDPGIGFGKSADHNFRLIDGLTVFHGLGCPIFFGASRKSFIAHVSAAPTPKERLPGSLAAGLAAAGQGVQWLRVHDVAETRQSLEVWQAMT